MFLNSDDKPGYAAAAKSLQSCPTLCDPIDGSPPGSPVPGILQARTLEWVAISFIAWKWKVKVKLLSRVQLFTTPWTVAYQAPPSMGFSRQEYWSGVPLPSLYILLDNPILCIWKHVCVCVCACETVTKSCLTLCDPMDCQISLSLEFSRQEYWKGLPFPSPGDLPDPGIEPKSSTLEADTLTFEPPGRNINCHHQKILHVLRFPS